MQPGPRSPVWRAFINPYLNLLAQRLDFVIVATFVIMNVG